MTNPTPIAERLFDLGSKIEKRLGKHPDVDLCRAAVSYILILEEQLEASKLAANNNKKPAKGGPEDA